MVRGYAQMCSNWFNLAVLMVEQRMLVSLPSTSALSVMSSESGVVGYGRQG